MTLRVGESKTQCAAERLDRCSSRFIKEESQLRRRVAAGNGESDVCVGFEIHRITKSGGAGHKNRNVVRRGRINANRDGAFNLECVLRKIGVVESDSGANHERLTICGRVVVPGAILHREVLSHRLLLKASLPLSNRNGGRRTIRRITQIER